MESGAALVGAARQRRVQRMDVRERAAAGVAALAAVLAAVVCAVLLPPGREADPLLLAALVAGYAVAARVEFEVGSGAATPDVLVLVPMLYLAPLDLVPLLVAGGLLLSRVPAFATRRMHPERSLYALADGWLAIGPAVVFALLEPGSPSAGDAGVWALAIGAQLATSFVPAVAREAFGLGTSLVDSARAVAWACWIDAALWPVSLLTVQATLAEPALLLALAPLVWLLAVFSWERRERHAAAIELSRAYRGTVKLLADVVESDDRYTGEHCRSVVDLAVAVADELGVERREREEIEFAALLHDVGKLAIPKELINKPAALTPQEFELVKTHTIEGQLLLDHVGGLMTRVGRIVRSCHERWDGRGYPDGLHGAQIPLAARIVFACDAFNAMTTDRPYRRALSTGAALAELETNAGSQFDPYVVRALARVVRRGAEAGVAVADPLPPVRRLVPAAELVAP